MRTPREQRLDEPCGFSGSSAGSNGMFVKRMKRNIATPKNSAAVICFSVL